MSVEHWSHYADVGDAQTETAIREAMSALDAYESSRERVNDDVLVASVLLRRRVELPDADDVERAMRRQQRVDTVVSSVPAPTFACARCGAMEHTARGARVHCMWSRRGGRNGRRRAPFP